MAPSIFQPGSADNRDVRESGQSFLAGSLNLRYFLCGQCVGSDIALPLVTCHKDQPIGLRIHLETGSDALDRPVPSAHVLAELHWGNGLGLTHVRAAEGYRLRYLSYCEALLSLDFKELVLRLAPGRTEEDAALLVIGGITAFMLSLQGRPPLHGSAVLRDGRTLGFLGSSGAGKSTLAALYCLDGALLIADDLLAMEGADRVHYGATELRLRPAARALVQRFPPDRVRSTVDGRFAVRCPSAGHAAPPLSALIAPVLSPTATEVAVRKLTGSQAFLALASSPRQLGLKQPALVQAAFTHFASIAKNFSVLEAVIPIERLRDSTLPRELDRQLDLIL